VGFGDEAEERTVAVKAPGTALLDDLEPRLVVPVEELVGDLPGGRLVGQLDRVGAEPGGGNDGDGGIGKEAADDGSWSQLLQRCDAAPPLSRSERPIGSGHSMDAVRVHCGR